jgi:hypothetical protein
MFPSVDAYRNYEESFAAVRAKITPQDRSLFLPSTGSLMSLTLMHKTASLVRIKEVYDYDALLVKRIVDYYNTLYLGESVHSVDELFLPKGKPGYRPRLLDLAAVRYVVTVPSTKVYERGLTLSRMGEVNPEIELYRNDNALPRAHYVPRVEIVADPPTLLRRLATGDDDLTKVGFMEEPPASGFRGDTAATAPGTTDFLLDDPEHLVIAVDAPARGFLVVADQYFPGWGATVNGASTPIMRGNYAFRIIEVPAGKSTVEMRYRPVSVAIGAAITAVASVVSVVVLLWGRRRR